MGKEEEKRKKWGQFFGNEAPREEQTINTNLKSIPMNEEVSIENKEAIEKQDEFIKQLVHDTAESIWSNLPHRRHGEVLRFIADIIESKHNIRIEECSQSLHDLTKQFEDFKSGMNV